MLHEVPVVRNGVLQAHAGLVRVTGGWPPSLRHDDVHIPVPELVHRCVNRVHLRIEHIGVVFSGGVVEKSGVRLEQRVVQRRRSESKEWIRIYHERRF